MGIYLLKFSACLAVFMIFYKLFLEKESFHNFKRFYLIGVLLLAAGIPLITFTTYIESVPVEITQNSNDFTTPTYVPEQLLEEPVNYIPQVLWSIYMLGVIIFTIRFGMNLFKMIRRIRQNPKFKDQSIVHVLLTDLIQPHTFLNYIFFNKEKYESHDIPKEVMLHEETHAKEKHALDILFIEVLQIAFWFNPLLYFIKKDIKLNHEFLADKAVINNGIHIKNYQNTLLAFSSHVQEPALANAINYSSIKKRFTVMKTHTSKTAIWTRSLVLLPLLAILIYSFSSTRQVEKGNFSKTLAANHTARSISINVLNNGTYEVDDIKATKKTFVSVINQLHQDITPEIRNQIINFHISSEKDISDNEVWFIYNSVIDYGFHRIVTYNQEIIREKGNKPFAITSIETQESSKVINKKTELQKGASKEQIAEYNTLAKYYNSQDKENYVIKLKDMKRLKYLYELMNAEQKNEAEPLPKFPPPPPPPAKSMSDAEKKAFDSMSNKAKNGESYSYKYTNKDGEIVEVEVGARDTSKPPPPPPPIPENATPEQNAKYKKAHEEYYSKYQVKNGKVSKKLPLPPPPVPANATPEQKAQYKKWHTEYYSKYQVKDGKVTEKSKLPPPPPPPKPSKTGFIDINGEKHYYATVEGKTKYYDRWGYEVDKKGKKLSATQTNGDDVVPGQKITKVYQNDQVVSEFKKNWESTNNELAPPPPPPPMPPLDFVIAMAKKNATFFYEGRSVSSDRAISLMKKNPNLNISAKNSESNNPRVFITTEPINHDSQDLREIPKPTAENAISHLKVMNRHGAKFYLDDKPVTFDEALKAVRKNKNADITSTMEPPVVKINTKLLGVQGKL